MVPHISRGFRRGGGASEPPTRCSSEVIVHHVSQCFPYHYRVVPAWRSEVPSALSSENPLRHLTDLGISPWRHPCRPWPSSTHHLGICVVLLYLAFVAALAAKGLTASGPTCGRLKFRAAIIAPLPLALLHARPQARCLVNLERCDRGGAGMRLGPRQLSDPVKPTLPVEGRGNGPEAFFRATPQKNLPPAPPSGTEKPQGTPYAETSQVADCQHSHAPPPLWTLVAKWLMPPPQVRSAYERPSNARA